MQNIKVLFFATLRDYAGLRLVELTVPPGMTVGSLIELLVATYPKLGKVKDSMMIAINREYATADQVIPENAEIAFFPPVSGG